ncbi:hypothetical protein LC55x_1502 [Lysobacter capsici]|nr:hypothetical protein LC55x_1502 [Lysobacter capsici]
MVRKARDARLFFAPDECTRCEIVEENASYLVCEATILISHCGFRRGCAQRSAARPVLRMDQSQDLADTRERRGEAQPMDQVAKTIADHDRRRHLQPSGVMRCSKHIPHARATP